MTKYYSNTLRIISIITLVAFISTQTVLGYEGRSASASPQKSHLRSSQAAGNSVGDDIANSIGAPKPQNDINSGDTAASISGSIKQKSFVPKLISGLLMTIFSSAVVWFALLRVKNYELRTHFAYSIFDNISPAISIINNGYLNDALGVLSVGSILYVLNHFGLLYKLYKFLYYLGFVWTEPDKLINIKGVQLGCSKIIIISWAAILIINELVSHIYDVIMVPVLGRPVTSSPDAVDLLVYSLTALAVNFAIKRLYKGPDVDRGGSASVGDAAGKGVANTAGDSETTVPQPTVAQGIGNAVPGTGDTGTDDRAKPSLVFEGSTEMGFWDKLVYKFGFINVKITVPVLIAVGLSSIITLSIFYWKTMFLTAALYLLFSLLPIAKFTYGKNSYNRYQDMNIENIATILGPIAALPLFISIGVTVYLCLTQEWLQAAFIAGVITTMCWWFFLGNSIAGLSGTIHDVGHILFGLYSAGLRSLSDTINSVDTELGAIDIPIEKQKAWSTEFVMLSGGPAANIIVSSAAAASALFLAASFNSSIISAFLLGAIVMFGWYNAGMGLGALLPFRPGYGGARLIDLLKSARNTRDGSRDKARAVPKSSTGLSPIVEIRKHREIIGILRQLKESGRRISVINFDAHDDYYEPRLYDYEEARPMSGNWVWWALEDDLAEDVFWLRPAWQRSRWNGYNSAVQYSKLNGNIKAKKLPKDFSFEPAKEFLVSIDFDYISSANYPVHRPSQEEIKNAVREIMQIFTQGFNVAKVVLCTSEDGGWVYSDQLEFIRQELSDSLKNEISDAGLESSAAKTAAAGGVQTRRDFLELAAKTALWGIFAGPVLQLAEAFAQEEARSLIRVKVEDAVEENTYGIGKELVTNTVQAQQCVALIAPLGKNRVVLAHIKPADYSDTEKKINELVSIIRKEGVNLNDTPLAAIYVGMPEHHEFYYNTLQGILKKAGFKNVASHYYAYAQSAVVMAICNKDSSSVSIKLYEEADFFMMSPLINLELAPEGSVKTIERKIGIVGIAVGIAGAILMYLLGRERVKETYSEFALDDDEHDVAAAGGVTVANSNGLNIVNGTLMPLIAPQPSPDWFEKIDYDLKLKIFHLAGNGGDDGEITHIQAIEVRDRYGSILYAVINGRLHELYEAEGENRIYSTPLDVSPRFAGMIFEIINTVFPMFFPVSFPSPEMMVRVEEYHYRDQDHPIELLIGGLPGKITISANRLRYNGIDTMLDSIERFGKTDQIIILSRLLLGLSARFRSSRVWSLSDVREHAKQISVSGAIGTVGAAAGMKGQALPEVLRDARIDPDEFTSVVYPASGSDHNILCHLLGLTLSLRKEDEESVSPIFRKIKTVYLIDKRYGPYDIAGNPEPINEANSPWVAVIKNKAGQKGIEIVFCAEDYYGFRPPREGAGRRIIIDKFPGQDAKMRKDLLFYRAILQDSKSEDLVLYMPFLKPDAEPVFEWPKENVLNTDVHIPGYEDLPNWHVYARPKMISDIRLISEVGKDVRHRTDLERIIEKPILRACEILYDKSIRTHSSSANKNDIGSGGYIYIYYDSLSEENKEIAVKLGKYEKLKGEGLVRIEVLIPQDAPVEDLSEEMAEKIRQFKLQAPVWAIVAEDYIQRSIAFSGNTLSREDVLRNNDFYEDVETKTVFLSEELCQKYKSAVSAGATAGEAVDASAKGAAAGLTYKEACEYRRRKLVEGIRFPKGFWDSPVTAKHFIWATLDTLEDLNIGNFKKARELRDVKTMANLYRKYVMGYQPRENARGRRSRQQTFFYEQGMKSLMVNKRPFLDKMGSPAALLRFALPELLDTKIEGALDPSEVENGYWDNYKNARYHILQALYTIDGFKDAHKANNLEKMTRLYKRHVMKYKPLNVKKYPRGGQRTFFVERGGLITLINHKRDFLSGHNSPLSLTCFAIPEFIPYLVNDPQKRAEFTTFYVSSGEAAAGGAVGANVAGVQDSLQHDDRPVDVSIKEESKETIPVLEEMEIIGLGHDSTVYRYKDKAYKVYHKLTFEQVKFYKSLTDKVAQALQKIQNKTTVNINQEEYTVHYRVNPIDRIFIDRVGRVMSESHFVFGSILKLLRVNSLDDYKFLEELIAELNKLQEYVVNETGISAEHMDLSDFSNLAMDLDPNAKQLYLTITDISPEIDRFLEDNQDAAAVGAAVGVFTTLDKAKERSKVVVVVGDDDLILRLQQKGVNAVGAASEAEATVLKKQYEQQNYFVIFINKNNNTVQLTGLSSIEISSDIARAVGAFLECDV